ncbi:MAG: hypothetical protein D6812_16545, partial [Deltaproteobacteria bacterium]
MRKDRFGITIAIAMMIFLCPGSLSASRRNPALSEDPLYIGAVSGEAFLLVRTPAGLARETLRTQRPVFQAFGLPESCGEGGCREILYIPLEEKRPSGTLMLEDLESGSLHRVSEEGHHVLRVAWNRSNPDLVAYTFSDLQAFGLAVADLRTGRVEVQVAEGVFPDWIGWDGDRLFYAEEAYESRPILDVLSKQPLESVPYARLSPRCLDLSTGRIEVSPTLDGVTFPHLHREIEPGAFLDPVVEGEDAFPPDLYAFSLPSPNGAFIVEGENLLGEGRIALRTPGSSTKRDVGAGYLLDVTDAGVIFRKITPRSTELWFAGWDGQEMLLGKTPAVTFNLPISTFVLTQGGESYPPPGNCNIYTHTAS